MEIVTNDRRMRELIQLAKTVAQSKATVVIQGESGTGKELMASLIHNASSRSERPFVAINCAAIPEQLLESELFGYEKGAFTGAVSSKAGKFELAHGGTLLLDEISEMDIRLQAKLLRAIQQGEIDRVGGDKPKSVDVRIICTTNRSLADCVKEGTFREDLFYRINVVNLTLPPLRDRIGDIEMLARYFVSQYGAKGQKGNVVLAEGALKKLSTHSWPGNIRELENVMERAAITAQGSVITDNDVVVEGRGNFKGSGFLVEPDANSSMAPMNLDHSLGVNWQPGSTLDAVERAVILDALKFHSGNRTHTAKALGISIRTLRNKLADYRKLGIRV